MSRAVNKAILIGRLGAEPELRYTAAGIPVVNLSLATNELFTNRSGEKVEQTQWHRLVLWRQLAELSAQYLHKGSLIYVEGPLRYRTWADAEGREHPVTEVEVRELSMLDRPRTETNGQTALEAEAPSAETTSTKLTPPEAILQKEEAEEEVQITW